MTILEKLAHDEFDAAVLRRGAMGPFSVVGAVLRAPGAFIRDLRSESHLGGYGLSLALTTLLFSAAYGAILGLFQPGLQTLYAAAKLPVVVLGTSLMCTPTFYVFNAILGSKFTFRQTLTAVLWLAAAVALVLVAFAPIVWFFTVSTRGPGFLVFLHVFVFFIAMCYGIHSLNTARKYLDVLETSHTPIHGAFLFLWFIIVLFVALQMAYYLRPFLEPLPDHRFFLAERGLFLEAFGSGSK